MTSDLSVAAVSDDKLSTSAWPRRLRSLGVLPPTVLLVVVAISLVPNFATRGNISELLFTMAGVGFVAIGMTFVVASGNFVDLSVVSQIAVAAVCVISLQGHGLIVGVVAGLAACALVGLVNAFAVAVLKGNAVIVTLATGTVCAGLLTLVTSGTLYQGRSAAFRTFGSSQLGVIPMGFLLLVLGLVVAHAVLTFTVFGRQVKLVGANPSFAAIAGISVPRTVIGCFVAASVGSCVAGIILAAYSNTASASLGQGYEFDALAAVVIGGNSLFGGRVSMARTALGLLLVSVIANILPLIGMPYEAQTICKGAIVIVAVVIDTVVNGSLSKEKR